MYSYVFSIVLPGMLIYLFKSQKCYVADFEYLIVMLCRYIYNLFERYMKRSIKLFASKYRILIVIVVVLAQVVSFRPKDNLAKIKNCKTFLHNTQTLPRPLTLAAYISVTVSMYKSQLLL